MFFRATLFGTAALVLASQASAQIPHATYRLVPKTVYESQIVTKYRPQNEIVVERKPVTTYRTETTTEMKERRYRVAKPVVETSEKIERYKVRRPVTETSFREEFVDRTRYESETKWEEQRRTVMKPVEETSERVERRTVMRPVKEYAYKNETYTTYRPKTTKGVRWRDAGGYVNVPQIVPGETGRQRLQWMGRQEYVNPTTGRPTTQRAGLYWVPQQGQPTVVNRPQYVSRYVPEEVECTSWEAEEVTRRVPVERTRYEEDVEYRKVPVTTKRMVAEEQFRFVPRTVQKPVTERYSRKVPVTSTKWVEEEVVRRVPQKTYKTVYEERVEKVPVEVRRTVPTKQLMEREKTIRRMVPYKAEVIVPKTVVEKQLIENSCGTPLSYSGRSVGQSSYGYSTIGQSATYGEWRPVVESGTSESGGKAADNAPELPSDFVPPAGGATQPSPDAEADPEADVDRGSKPQQDLTGLLNF